RRRHTRSKRDWSSDVCSSDLRPATSKASAMPQGIPKLPVHKEFRCITVPMTPVTTPTATVPRIQPMPRRPEGLLGFGACPRSGEFDTFVCIQHNLTNPDCFRSYFYTLIVANPFERFFQGHNPWWCQALKVIG